VSDTDSFIEEVGEEVRRDKLFKLMRKYGWIAILLVLLMVGGAAFNEYRKARAISEAQAFGDAILAALQADDPAARAAELDAIDASGTSAGILSFVSAGVKAGTDDRKSAIGQLQAVAQDTTMPEVYRHLAELKLILLQGDDLPVAERMARLEPLMVAGAPFRLLAEEQMAMILIADGDVEAGLSRLQSILADGDVTAGLRRRASQLIVALGGELQPA